MTGPTEATGNVPPGILDAPHAATDSDERRATRAGHDRRRAATAHPGGQSNGAPAHQVDMEVIDRLAAPAPDVRDEPVTAVGDARAFRASSAATANSRPSIGPSASVRSAAEAIWRRGIEQDVGRRAWRDVAERDRPGRPRGRGRRDRPGHDPAEQAVATARPRSAPRRSPQHWLRAHQEPDRADQPGHQVRHVALALRARSSQVSSSAAARIPTSRRRFGRWMKNAMPRFDEVDRERHEQPRLREQR